MAEKRKMGTDNEKALLAWNEWKDVCAVNACNVENQRVLENEISGGFKKKLNAFADAFVISEDYDFGEIDFVAEFDAALFEYKYSDVEFKDEKAKEEKIPIYHRGHFGDKNYIRKAKNWKDFTWTKVSDSPDPELKVIRGKLIGPVSVMDRIVEDYLSRNCPGRFCEKDGKKVYILDKQYQEYSRPAVSDDTDLDDFKTFHPEADTTLSSGNGQELEGNCDSGEDCFEKYLVEEKIDQRVLEGLKRLLEKSIDVKECAIVLANAYGIVLYKEKEILAELGVSKSAVYNAMSKIQAKMLQLFSSSSAEEYREVFINIKAIRKMMLDWMKERLCVEKYAPSLLSRIDDICGE